jgi:hypothetical protein
VTPEEKAVIEAAMLWRDRGEHERARGTLETAVDALIATRDECRCVRTERMYCHAENCHGGADVADWVPATIADALAGDRVRLGGSEAVVEGVGPAWHGHVRPGSGTSSNNPPMAQEHTLIPIRLAGRKELLHLAPTLAIEILADASRRAALVLQHAFPGSTSITS